MKTTQIFMLISTMAFLFWSDKIILLNKWQTDLSQSRVHPPNPLTPTWGGYFWHLHNFLDSYYWKFDADYNYDVFNPIRKKHPTKIMTITFEPVRLHPPNPHGTLLEGLFMSGTQLFGLILLEISCWLQLCHFKPDPTKLTICQNVNHPEPCHFAIVWLPNV